ncbi:hypothetical protein B7992_15910, partial [Fibrobacter sp. UWH1]
MSARLVLVQMKLSRFRLENKSKNSIFLKYNLNFVVSIIYHFNFLSKQFVFTAKHRYLFVDFIYLSKEVIMTTLQMDAIRRIETLSDDKVFYVIQILDGLDGLLRDAKEKQTARDQAFDTLEK